MRNGIILASIAFAVAFAVIVGNRLSNEAMAVVVGAVCGISASIPVTIGLVIAASNNWGRPESRDEPQRFYDAPRAYAPQPPLVIVSPPQAQMPYGFPPTPEQYYLPPSVSDGSFGSREFKIVGGE